jgi:hypothetical protein
MSTSVLLRPSPKANHQRETKLTFGRAFEKEFVLINPEPNRIIHNPF